MRTITAFCLVMNYWLAIFIIYQKPWFWFSKIFIPCKSKGFAIYPQSCSDVTQYISLEKNTTQLSNCCLHKQNFQGLLKHCTGILMKFCLLPGQNSAIQPSLQHNMKNSRKVKLFTSTNLLSLFYLELHPHA